jgi:hypothetical protein
METSSVQKESPIDLLMTQLYKKGFLKEVDGNEPINLMNKAKEMEKEQIIEFAIKFTYGTKRVGESIKKDFIKLYNETYGGSEQ